MWSADLPQPAISDDEITDDLHRFVPSSFVLLKCRIVQHFRPTAFPGQKEMEVHRIVGGTC
jgi:hypothetical protein